MPAAVRNFLLSPLLREPGAGSPPTASTLCDPAPSFPSLVGKAGWSKLPAAVQERFAAAPSLGTSKTYTGVMGKMTSTWLGKVFAFLCTPLGRPLPGPDGVDIPSTVKIYQMPDGRGVMWERQYVYPGKSPVMVKSFKKLHARHGLLEYTRAGLGMFLNIYEEKETLVFESTGYFIEIANRFLRIPEFMTPGVAIVRHTDLGAGNFEFALTFDHPRFGRLFNQVGTFRLEGDKQ